MYMNYVGKSSLETNGSHVVFDNALMSAWNEFSTELVLDSMTTVSYNIDSLFLLNWIAKSLIHHGIMCCCGF